MKILLSIPELPFDPTNGAARSMRTIAELMASRGHEVRCVATTATERRLPNLLVPEGLSRGVEYRLVNVRGEGTNSWRTQEREKEFDRLFTYLAWDWKPDILLCYGGHHTDVARFHLAKRAGVKIVFGLRNYGYQQPGFFNFCDGIITSSRFLSDWYRTRFHVLSTSLPLPIWPDDVVALQRIPVYFTAINPTKEKGMMILATVFRVLGETRPDIPLQVVSDDFEFWSGGSRYGKTVKLVPWQSNPRDIYAQTKVLLVPSIWEEPAGRVIAEALLNGIPAIITNRGGMPEVANGGAVVLPLDPMHMPSAMIKPVEPRIAQPWIDAITWMHDSDLLQQTERAKLAGRMYLPEKVAPLYESYFESILAGKSVPVGVTA